MRGGYGTCFCCHVEMWLAYMRVGVQCVFLQVNYPGVGSKIGAGERSRYMSFVNCQGSRNKCKNRDKPIKHTGRVISRSVKN